MRPGRGGTTAGTQRSGRGRQLRKRTTREYLRVVDANAAAARGHDARLDIRERLVAARNPVRALHGFGRERPAARDVPVHVEPQLRNRRRDGRLRVAIEVRGDRRFELGPCAIDRALVGLARGLHVFRHSPVVTDELFHDGARATCERLVRVLHLANRVHRFASGLGRDRVADENDARHGREAEKQAAPDAEPERAACAFSRQHVSF